MKHLRQLCAGLLLVLALSANALAGDILTPGVTGTAESPGYTGVAESPGFAGIMDTPSVTGEILTPGLYAGLSFLL
jgi:hypothetical protein